MIDVILLAIVALVTWTVAAEGAWGAASMFIAVTLSGLVAMNYFEPLSVLLESMLGPDWSVRYDFIVLMVLFGAGVFLLRLMTEKIVPGFIAVHSRVYDVCRWGFGAMTGYVTMSFLLTAMHTAPLPRDFLGFTPERRNFFSLTAPDRDWLGFVQYVSEKSLQSSEDGRVFDGTQFHLEGHDNQVWPTFVIRYASRREGYSAAAGGSAAATAPITPGGTDAAPATLKGVRGGI